METEGQDDSNLVKDLRKQLKEAQAAAREATEELSVLKSAKREATVTEFLKAKGVNPKAAKFIPTDLEDEESWSTWLEENGDVFGGQSSESSKAGVSTEAADATRRANALQERSVSPDKVADIQARIENANSVDELNSAMSDLRKYML